MIEMGTCDILFCIESVSTGQVKCYEEDGGASTGISIDTLELFGKVEG